jgi:nucleoid-associated protein YgaU
MTSVAPMTGARSSQPAAVRRPVRSAAVRPRPARPSARQDPPNDRRPQSGAPVGAPGAVRRDPLGPGVRGARRDGLAGGRPVRGGCAALPAVTGRRVPAGRRAAGGGVGLRLTRRGRRLVAALSIATGLCIAAVTASTVLGGTGDGLQLAGRASVVVESGDTLWSIAREVAPEEDTRAVVDAIEAVNELEGTLLVPGQVLQLP